MQQESTRKKNVASPPLRFLSQTYYYFDMLLFQQCFPHARLGVWQMNETLQELEALLPARVVDEACRRFKPEHRRHEWLAVRALLFQLLGHETEVGYRPSGKPYLTNEPMQVSFSHTRGYVAVIVGSETVGVDIEQVGNRVRRVADRFMRPDEEARLYQGTDLWSLLLHWSAKETIFKCIDSNEVDFIRHLRIFPFTPQNEGSFSACEYRTPMQRSFLIGYKICPEFVLTYISGT